MSTIFRLFSDSFAVFRRNMILVYPLLLFLLLVSVLMHPESGALPTLDMKWILLIGSIILLFFAFLAGWNNMMYEACRRWVFPDKTPPVPASQTQTPPTGAEPFKEIFSLFGYFLPGVGEFFGSFLIGGLIQVGVALLIFYGAQTLIEQGGGVPHVLEKMTALKTQAEVNTFIAGLPVTEQEQMGRFSMVLLGAMAVYGMFYLLTMLWGPYVIVHRVNVFKAYGLSMRQWVRDPLRILAIALLFFMVYSLLLLLQPNDMGLMLLFQFIFLFLKTLFGLVLFVYLLQTHPSEQAMHPPVIPEESPPASET